MQVSEKKVGRFTPVIQPEGYSQQCLGMDVGNCDGMLKDPGA